MIVDVHPSPSCQPYSMRLLQLHLTEHFGEPPHYAILSHTWGPDDEEVSFKDITHGKGIEKEGYRKLLAMVSNTTGWTHDAPGTSPRRSALQKGGVLTPNTTEVDPLNWRRCTGKLLTQPH
jgi:hypothetical protein